MGWRRRKDGMEEKERWDEGGGKMGWEDGMKEEERWDGGGGKTGWEDK